MASRQKRCGTPTTGAWHIPATADGITTKLRPRVLPHVQGTHSVHHELQSPAVNGGGQGCDAVVHTKPLHSAGHAPPSRPATVQLIACACLQFGVYHMCVVFCAVEPGLACIHGIPWPRGKSALAHHHQEPGISLPQQMGSRPNCVHVS